MEHIKSSFYFKTNSESWRLDYTYKGHYLKATVFLDEELYWDFDSLPITRTERCGYLF